MSNKNQLNGELEQINMSFTLTDDSESIKMSQSDQNDIIYNIDCISDQSLPQQQFQKFINEQENIFEKHNISSIHEQPSSQEQKTHHQTQITFGKGLPTCMELNQEKLIIDSGLNKSSFKNYKQYVVNFEKLQDEQKVKMKKQTENEQNSHSCITETTNLKSNSSVVNINNSNAEKIQNRDKKQNQYGQSSIQIMNNNSQSNLKSSTTHDETQSTNMMTCMLEKTQTESLEFLKKQLIILQSENERITIQLSEKDQKIQEMKNSMSGLRQGVTIRDYEQTISKQAIELIQIRQSNEQLQKENKQLQQELVKNRAEGFQKYEDLKKNNEELLEAYEEKFQCQMDLVKENYQKQISSLEVKLKQDQQMILDLQISNENQYNRIQQLEKENQKLQGEKDQFLELSNKYKELKAFFEAQNKQIKNINPNTQQQNDNLSSNQQNQINCNNSLSMNQLNSAKFQKNINQNQQNSNQTSVATNQNQISNYENNNSLSFNDIQKLLQKQGLSQEQTVRFKEKINSQIQNIQNNQSKILSPRGTDHSPQQSRDKNMNSLQNKSAIKKQKSSLENQPSQDQNDLIKNNFQTQGNSNNSNNMNHIERTSSKGVENNNIKKEQDYSNLNKIQQQKSFQLELGQAQEAQKQLQYSYSTQITKRNHYLQQNISHRHYPSQLNSNQNLSHNKSCEEYNSPMSHRENSNSKSRIGATGNQSIINLNNSQQKQIVNNKSKKDLNSSGNHAETNIFQHETIKEYLSPQINQTISNYRDNNYKAVNKYLQQKKKKGINSQEQHSFYNTINTNSSSNSLLISSTSKTQIQDSIPNSFQQNKINQKSRTNINQTQISHPSSSFINDRQQSINEEQRNNSNNIKTSQQKMAKSFSNQQLINQQQLIHQQQSNLNKQKTGAQSFQQQVGRIPLPYQTHSQSIQNAEGQETYSPRINTSRSTNANKNNLTAQKLQEKQATHQLSSRQMTESPQIKRQDRSASNSNFKSFELENEIPQKQNKNSTFTQINSGQQQQNNSLNKQLIQINKASVLSKIKSQIQQQQQQQQYQEQSNQEIVDI